MPISKVSGLEYEIMYKGAFAMLQTALPKGSSFLAESDAMVAMSPTLDIEATMGDEGFLNAIGRAVLAGEKMFLQRIKAERGDGVIFFAPSYPGDIAAIEMDGSIEYNICKDGYLASTVSVDVKAQMQNLAKGFLSGNGLFILKASGKGTLFVSSYGAIDYIDIPAGQTFVIDNGHLVAWPARMGVQIKKASSSGVFHSMLSGEGFVLHMRGPGRVFFQSRNLSSFKSWVNSLKMS